MILLHLKRKYQLKNILNNSMSSDVELSPALQKEFNYSSPMQIPVLKKIVVNQGLGDATQDKKIIEVQ